MTDAQAGLLSHLGGAWNRFFHAPRDLRICALIRIAYALLVLIWLAVLFPDLSDWFSESGLLPLETARKVVPARQWSLLELLPPTSSALHAAYGIAVVQAALLLVGFLSRLNAACVFAWVVSFANRNYLILDSEDAVFQVLGFLLILTPCGACWSVDAWLFPLRSAGHPRERVGGVRNDRQSAICNPQSAIPHAPAWGLCLIQIQMCLIFISAALSKLQSPEWRDGTAMYYVSRLDDYFGRFPTPDFLWQTPWIVAAISWGVIACELAIPVVIWWRPARRWALAALLLFHLANEYTMHLFLFHWIMLAGWAAFLTGDDLELLRRLFASRPRTK